VSSVKWVSVIGGDWFFVPSDELAWMGHQGVLAGGKGPWATPGY
jgi:hypothetical protein